MGGARRTSNMTTIPWARTDHGAVRRPPGGHSKAQWKSHQTERRHPTKFTSLNADPLWMGCPRT